MKTALSIPVAKRLGLMASGRKQELALQNLLRMRSDFARRQRVGRSWGRNLNLVSPSA